MTKGNKILLVISIGIASGIAVFASMPKKDQYKIQPTPFLTQKSDGGWKRCVTPVGWAPCKDVEVYSTISECVIEKGPNGLTSCVMKFRSEEKCTGTTTDAGYIPPPHCERRF